MSIGLFPLLLDRNGTPDTSLAYPFTFSSAHFHLTLPDQPGVSITDGGLLLIAQNFVYNGNQTKPFRIGPHVPDRGSTLLLLLSA